MSDYCIRFVRFFLKLFHIRVNKEKEHLLIQIFKFLLVGGIATIIDFVFLYLFRDIVKLNLILANTLSFIISVTYNYIASISFVFNVNNGKSKKKNFILFITFSIIGLIINNIILYIVTNMFKLYYMLSKVIATIFVMIFNFITRKRFLENKSN